MDWLLNLSALPMLRDPGLVPVIMAGLVFGSVFLASLIGMRGLVARAGIRRRAKHERGEHIGPRLLNERETLRASELLSRVGRFLAPTDAESYSRARKEMIKAGLFSPSAVLVYHAARILLGLGLPMLMLAVLGSLPLGLSTKGLLATVAMLAAGGFIAPSFYIQSRQRKMKQQYRSGFPDFMDLLVVCVESGLSLQPSIERISRELTPTAPQFGANLHLVVLEMRAGSSLGGALDSLTERLDIEEAFSLASLLKQSEELGTSLSSALRVYSDEMRDKRLMRAEAKAHALPVKITLPVGFCIFPVILVILFLPLIIRIKAVLV